MCFLLKEARLARPCVLDEKTWLIESQSVRAVTSGRMAAVALHDEPVRGDLIFPSDTTMECNHLEKHK